MPRKLMTALLALAMVFAAAAVAVSPARADDDDDDGGGGGAPAIAFGQFVPTSAGPARRRLLRAGQRAARPATAAHHLHEQLASFTYTAELVCVSIVGDTARFGYVIPSGDPDVPDGIEGLNIIWQVTDNELLPVPGPPIWRGSPSSQTRRSATSVGAPESPIQSGEIVVAPRRRRRWRRR